MQLFTEWIKEDYWHKIYKSVEFNYWSTGWPNPWIGCIFNEF